MSASSISPSLAERTKIFRFVRDIPYRIALSDQEQDYCCATKMPMLQRLLASAGLKSRRIFCSFSWSTTKLPLDLIAQAPNPEEEHEYLEVYVIEANKWISIDPTWDAPLKASGFPIAEWDGVNSTALAVVPIKVFSPEESASKIKQIDETESEAWQEFYAVYGAFFKNVNKWLDQQRSKGF